MQVIITLLKKCTFVWCLAARLAEYIDAQATAPLSDPLKIYVLYVYTYTYVYIRVYLIFKRIFCRA
jgi:hypothetical protein